MMTLWVAANAVGKKNHNVAISRKEPIQVKAQFVIDHQP